MKRMPNLKYLDVKGNFLDYDDQFYETLRNSNLRTLKIPRTRYLDNSLDIFYDKDKSSFYETFQERLMEQKPNLKL
ncbi:hypothetical protein ROZALSC1DRAFT_30361, partial [Rozella allomycis CSF55]